MSDPWIVVSTPNPLANVVQDRATAEDPSRRADRIRQEVQDANTGTLQLATRVLSALLFVATAALLITLFNPWPLWQLLLLALVGFGLATAVLRWGEDRAAGPHRRRRR